MPYAKRTVLPGYPKKVAFECREQIDVYLQDEKICCLLCGHRFKLLEPHLRSIHEMSGDDYREKYDLPFGRGLCSAGFTQRKIALGKQLFEENADRQSAALTNARQVQSHLGNPQRHKPQFWKAERSGVNNVNAKLTPAKVRAIRTDKRGHTETARDWEITPQNIYAVRKQKIWKEV